MKILVVLPRFPYPLEKGDKLRAFNQIKELSKTNDIYLFCVSHTPVQPAHLEMLRPYCKAIRVVRSPKLVNYKNVLRNYLSTKSLQLGYWDSVKARKAYKAFERMVMPDVLYNQMVRTMPLVSRSSYPKVMDFQDALSMNFERRMDSARFLLHYFLHFEFKMLRSTEYNAFKIFDALTIISEPDSDAIPHQRNSDIHIIPNGVDFEYFKPISCPKQYDIVFCGNMNYEPNVRAATYLAQVIMPIVWGEVPQAKLLLAGASPRGSVRKLQSSLITVSGTVPDIRQCYASSKVFAAPMLSGSGLQNKLLEAMSMQLPCVTTSIANASLRAQHGTQVLVGDTAQAFAQHIITLLQQPQQAQQMALAGSQYVKDNFCWSKSSQQLEQILQQVVNQKSGTCTTN
ncbi:MAG: glycosyltransferase [Bacteroidales bacterium]|nr:glycosyltransferase [Bacteroidales bacterium]